MQIRLLPIVLIALTSVLALRLAELATSGGIDLASVRVAMAQESSQPAQQPEFGQVLMDIRRSRIPPTAEEMEMERRLSDPGGITTGSVDAPKKSDTEVPPETKPTEGTDAADKKADPAAAPETAPADAAPKQPMQTEEPLIAIGGASDSERALLESLSKRREELDALARELDMRENLLKAAEKRIESRVAELKSMEDSFGATEAKREEDKKSQLVDLVKMYEAMKPKDAARIFSRLDILILTDVAKAMKPGVLAPIVAAMDADAAQRLTVALAGGNAPPPVLPPSASDSTELPKIQGNPVP